MAEITYTVIPPLDFGGFGNNVISYARALYASRKLQIPLIYRPFRWSNGIKLSNSHKNKPTNHKKIKIIKGKFETIDPTADVLYELGWGAVQINWDDEFIKLLRDNMQPIVQRNLNSIPNSIAIHARLGSKVDRKRFSGFVHKFYYRPDFYRIALQYLKETFGLINPKIVAYTDQPGMMKELSKQIRTNIMVSNEKPLDDFYSLMRHEFLIRTESSFSYLQTMICNYKEVIHYRHPNQLITHNARLKPQKQWNINKYRGWGLAH